ncbi:hypothetical protein [Methylibium sp.]|uniref:hypothetical protein n=1 Tax=Methylibium sp. TaxID=2067992 RepID=UPI003BAD8A7B
MDDLPPPPAPHATYERLRSIDSNIAKLLNVAYLIAALLAVSLFTGCASTGIVPMDAGVYLLSKKSPQVGFGPPIGIKGEVYAEANEFCSRKGLAVQTTRYEETNASFARSAAVALEFRCAEAPTK